MKFKNLSLVVVACSWAGVGFADSDLKSPYFIDGVHCSGLDRTDKEKDLKKKVLPTSINLNRMQSGPLR